MKYPVYNQKGEEVSPILLPKEVFELKINHDLVHQVAISQRANKRTVIASTKDRGEVRGGGKKPWRQKGTGRARHGSIRSPIWRSGGITFGPTNERNFKKKINDKMRRKALLMVLSAKAKEGLILVLEDISIEKPRTKEAAEVIRNLRKKVKNFKQGSILAAFSGKNKNLVLSARNIPGFSTIDARNLNVLDVLSYKYLIIAKDSVKVIKDTFVK